MKNISIELASDIQNATINFVNQNNNIQAAITALKNITHSPLGVIPNTNKLISKDDYLGINEEDRKVISEFIFFLEKKQVPLREVFVMLINEI
jgi:hypothetical protein